MSTTAIGLAIGIPTLAAYNLLAAKAETLVAEIEAYASHLTSQLRPQGAGDDGETGAAGGTAGEAVS
jgi:biopolymer transport protein ExbB/TolQ